MKLDKTTLAMLALSGLMVFSTLANARAQVQNQRFFEVTSRDAEKAVSEALVSKGVGQGLQVTLVGSGNNNAKGTLYDYHKPLSIVVKTLQFDATAKRWSANLYFLAEGEVVSAIPASGRFEETVEVPVLRRALSKGDSIEMQDLDWARFTASHARGNMVQDPDLLIGKSPRRSIAAGRPIRAEEIGDPILIRKNGMVRMVYRANGVEISADGVALDAGAKGEMVQVRNLNSKQVVRAMVENSGVVSISRHTADQVALR